MNAINATKARAGLYGLIQQVNESHEPVEIHGRQGAAVLVGAEDWRSIQETLRLLSIPGMRESIREGLETPLDQCSGESPW